MDLQDAIGYIGALDNASGQICQMRDGKPHMLLFEFGCPNCSEVESRNADDMGEALATIVNAAPDLAAQVVDLRARLATAEAERDVLKKALKEIDRHVIGAYETAAGSVEPCDECGEMREIAAQGLARAAAQDGKP